ncbi:MAG: nuclear transport factor 2 family protein [Bacteroidota bacterium]
MRRLIYSCFFCLPILLSAQSAEEMAVKAAIDSLFSGMLAGDSAQVSALLHPDVRLQTAAYDKEGKPVLQGGSLDRWLGTIASYPAGTLDERIAGYRFEIDPPLATAWTDYQFYAGGKFLHCGTNAFQLVKLEEGWLIHQVTDTRRKEDCLTPEQTLGDFVDAWHHAAAVADEDTFFGSMTESGIYIGTDATERWTRDEFQKWAGFAFERESAWAFTAYDRNIYLTPDGQYAWWEELLETWMGPCRGSGVAVWQDGGWKIEHYHLSVTVTNDKIEGFLELTKDE